MQIFLWGDDKGIHLNVEDARDYLATKVLVGNVDAIRNMQNTSSRELSRIFLEVATELVMHPDTVPEGGRK